MSQDKQPTDLQQYHWLNNEITELKRLLNNANSRAQKHKEASAKGNDRQARMIKAQTLLSLNLSGDIDWTIKEIASSCCLSERRIQELKKSLK